VSSGKKTEITNRPFRSKVQGQLDQVKRQIQTIKAAPSSRTRVLAPDVAEAIKFCGEQIEALSQTKDKSVAKKIRHYEEEIQRRERNPSNWVTSDLLPGPAAELARLADRAKELEAVLLHEAI
jgi:hypothetical protein